MPVISGKDARCREIEALIAAEYGVCKIRREMAIPEKTFYRWRS